MFRLRVVGHALQQAGARWLEVDPRELGVLTIPEQSGHLPILYDNTPGGSGHVVELAREKPREVLELALSILEGEKPDEHDATCRLACLRCLLSFETQHAYRQGLLDRRAAASLLQKILRDTPLATPPRMEPVPAPSTPAPRHQRPLTDREQAARDGLARRQRRGK